MKRYEKSMKIKIKLLKVNWKIKKSTKVSRE